jgi:alginate O-acetyltransferase complex protein AlgF
MKKYIAILMLGACFSSGFAMAEDEGLYDPAPPSGSAFVRFVNADDAPAQPEAKGKKHARISTGVISPYYPVAAGQTDLKLGESTASQDIEEGAFYTAILKDAGLTIVKDQSPENPAKAVLAFYNLTDKEELSLKTDDGKVEIIPATGAGESGYREVNGVEIKAAAYDGSKKVADAGPVDLKRGKASAVLVTQEGDAFKASAVQAETETSK